MCSECYKHDGCLGLVFACELGVGAFSIIKGEVKKGAGREEIGRVALCRGGERDSSCRKSDR